MSNIKKRLTLAEKIKFARKSVGMSQRQLGKILKITDKAISSYEVGRATPPMSALKEISKVTYQPVSYFINEEEKDEPSLREKIHTIEKELKEIKELLQKLDIKK